MSFVCDISYTKSSIFIGFFFCFFNMFNDGNRMKKVFYIDSIIIYIMMPEKF